MNPNGRRGYQYFSTKAEADIARADYLAATREKSELRVLSKAQQMDALRAIEMLAERGLVASLVQVVELAMPLLHSTGQNMTARNLFEEFVEIKSANWSAASIRNFSAASKLFLAEFEECSLVSLSAKTIASWLASNFESEGYRSNILRTIRPAFSYAVRQDMLPSSPFAKIEKSKIQHKEIDVFTPAEARALMDAAPQVAKAAYAILLFAGVRPVELTRLLWADVRDGYIHISAANAKTTQARNIEIEPILAARLEEWRSDDSHSIIPRNWKRINQATRSEAGLASRQDTARHSYASYYLAFHQNTEALKANLGHSRNSDMLFVYYRAAVTRPDALDYWAILKQ